MFHEESIHGQGCINLNVRGFKTNIHSCLMGRKMCSLRANTRIKLNEKNRLAVYKKKQLLHLICKEIVISYKP